MPAQYLVGSNYCVSSHNFPFLLWPAFSFPKMTRSCSAPTPLPFFSEAWWVPWEIPIPPKQVGWGGENRAWASKLHMIAPMRGVFKWHWAERLQRRTKDRAGNRQAKAEKTAKLFFICRTSSSGQITFLNTIDMTKLNFLAWAWIFFSSFFKSQIEECISFRSTSVSPVLSAHKGSAQS